MSSEHDGEGPGEPMAPSAREGPTTNAVTRPEVRLKRDWPLLAGGGSVALGIVTIVLGYQGAAKEPNPANQLPYMISGGALGLAFVALGVLLVLAFLLLRLGEGSVAQERLLREVREALDDVNEALEVVAEGVILPKSRVVPNKSRAKAVKR